MKVAKEHRDEVERDTCDRFKQIKAGRVIPATQSAVDRGASWRETLTALKRDPDANGSEPVEFSLYDIAADLAQEELEELRDEKDTKAFARGLTGRHAFDQFLEQLLTGAGLAERTASERRGLVKQFAAWATTEGLGMLDIDRKTAGRYVAEKIAPRDRRTGKKHLTAVRTYWDYLKRRGHMEFDVSPWHDQLEPQGVDREPRRSPSGSSRPRKSSGSFMGRLRAPHSSTT